MDSGDWKWVVGGLCVAVMALATTCWKLMLKVIACHVARIKYVESQRDYAVTLKAEVHKDE